MTKSRFFSFCQSGFYPVGQVYELLYRQLFGALVEYRVGTERMALVEDAGDGVSQSLSALVESRLHDKLEQLLVASQVGGFVAGHADDGTLHLWGRIEHMFVYRKEIFHLVPCLDEHAQDAVSLASRTCGDSFGHFFLDISPFPFRLVVDIIAFSVFPRRRVAQPERRKRSGGSPPERENFP